MKTRRSFLTGLLATGLLPSPTWADVGAPAFLSAAKTPSGAFVLVGINLDFSEAFRLPLPARGHAAAAHPIRPEAVAFARRPGNYALVIDCLNGEIRARLDAPQGRHFFGHGAFSAQGDVMFTTEKDYENAQGMIGVWDVSSGYKRIGEFASGGIGPHEIAQMPSGDALVIANGGIETHPDSGRTKLNIPTMRPNLTYATFDGTITDQIAPPSELHRNSIRHLAVSTDGTVAIAMQWQGDKQQIVPLVGTHTSGDTLNMFDAPKALWREMQGYVGSIAISGTGNHVATTSPRGNIAVVFDTTRNNVTDTVSMEDVCGVAVQNGQIIATSGQGLITTLSGSVHTRSDLQFDNHLVQIRAF
ncbi:DUF1513 domain-containing protein [Shimia sp.]|uniref:DUF1513 domain-containing protein n=1 Tax=Shimia sp. TaxID=1954381 RepID=UPI00329753EB